MKNFIKILSILMVLAMLASVFAACTDNTETPDTDSGTTDTDGSTDTQPDDGGADNGEVIKILNLDSFLLLVAALNKDPSQSIGKTYRLMINLDIYPGWDATPSEKLGKLIKPDAITEFAGINEFYGTFDGNGKTITGFYMADTAAATDNVAIFKKLNGGTIKNLTVNSAFIYDDGAKGAIVSGLVGTVTGDNSVIENVTVNSNVYAATDADEIDMVINVGQAKMHNYEYIQEEIRMVVSAAAGKTVKVIIETCYLTEEEKIECCKAAKAAGATFVKTSTGFGPAGATKEDIALMRETVGPEMGVKAAGGVRNLDDLMAMVENGATRIGTSGGVAIMQNASVETDY